MEKQGMPAVGISLERATDHTPDTTPFHLFHHDTLIASFARRRQAEQAYHAAIAASGYQPPTVEETDQAGVSAAARERHGREGGRR